MAGIGQAMALQAALDAAAQDIADAMEAVELNIAAVDALVPDQNGVVDQDALGAAQAALDAAQGALGDAQELHANALAAVNENGNALAVLNAPQPQPMQGMIWNPNANLFQPQNFAAQGGQQAPIPAFAVGVPNAANMQMMGQGAMQGAGGVGGVPGLAGIGPGGPQLPHLPGVVLQQGGHLALGYNLDHLAALDADTDAARSARALLIGANAAFRGLFMRPQHIARLVAPYIRFGLLKHKVLPTDIHVYHLVGTPPLFATIPDLIRAGTPIFDAMFYLSLPIAARPDPIEVDNLPAGLTTDLGEVGKALGYVFFFLLTRSNYPIGHVAAAGAQVPSFLYSFLGLREAPSAYARRLATFDLNKVDPGWIKFISIPGLSREAQARFSLGIAGYRYLSIFKYFEPMPNLPIGLLTSARAVKAFALRGYFWDVHPATRDPAFGAHVGSLNKELINLITEVFSPADKLIMIGQKMVPPQIVFALNPRFLNHRTWTNATFQGIEQQIFAHNVVAPAANNVMGGMMPPLILGDDDQALLF